MRHNNKEAELIWESYITEREYGPSGAPSLDVSTWKLGDWYTVDEWEDEIGQISADYFTELMAYAKHLEFVFINGTAANDDDIIEAYPRIYMGTRESSNEVELSLIDTIDAMDDW